MADGHRLDRSPTIILDSITRLAPAHAGRVVIAGSHGGVYAGYLAAAGGVRGVIFSDAGVGLEGAGVGALPLLAAIGLAAAAVDFRSARIGDGADLCRRGTISHVNDPAAAMGCEVGELADLCAEKMKTAPLAHADAAPPTEGRITLRAQAPQIRGVDSNSLLTGDDAGTIVISGSHGGLLGGNGDSAIGPEVLAAAFNDAGMGIDNAGISRLPALDARNIPAVTVSAFTARIGDARSSWMTGIISAHNAAAARHGAKPGIRLSAFLGELAARMCVGAG